MSVLITGGAGFLGSHLTETLVSEGEEVTVVDDLSRGTKDNLSSVMKNDNFEFIKADLQDEETAQEAVKGHDRVYHLAAKIGGVGYLRDSPADIISSNDVLNRNVFGACAQQGTDRIVYAGSSMVYSEQEDFPSREDDVGSIPPPRGAYGFQKLNGEYYCRAYEEQYGLEYSTVRIFNGVGPRDWPEEEVGHGHVVPDLVKKIVELEQDPVSLKGSGEQTRCFTDVRDLVAGLKKAMNVEGAAGEAFNIGTSEETSIKELATKIWKVSGREGDISFETEKSFDRDVKRRVPSNEKAHDVLDWEPRYGLEEMLETYIDAYQRRFL